VGVFWVAAKSWKNKRTLRGPLEYHWKFNTLALSISWMTCST